MTLKTPSETFGPLFVAVQERRLFPDSKTFADAVPKRPPEAILEDWRSDEPKSDAALLAFVEANFILPMSDGQQQADLLPLDDHIAALWPRLTREDRHIAQYSSALPLPEPYVVPGGRFRELYYWDSYFTMLGLARSGLQHLVEGMIANFGSLIDRFGHIPNGTRCYYLSRSHPPVFYLMAGLSRDGSEEGRHRRLAWMRAEHCFWMAGEQELRPGNACRRVVRLADGSLLNRYWDDHAGPRDESWIEDVALARATPDRPSAELWRDLRAAAESGWDFSSRWLGDGKSLGTIRTTRIVPVDLNSLLYGLELRIADEASALGIGDATKEFSDRGRRRAAAIEANLWNDAQGHYADRNLDTEQVSAQPTAAMAFPLFVGQASQERAQRTARALENLLHRGGLGTTDRCTGEQWDAPNGWAPLQWIAWAGLLRYGETELATSIADRWLDLIDRQYRATGQLFEKYDVETGAVGSGGEYPVEIGFGWTNGVALELSYRKARQDGLAVSHNGVVPPCEA